MRIHAINAFLLSWIFEREMGFVITFISASEDTSFEGREESVQDQWPPNVEPEFMSVDSRPQAFWG